MSKVDIISIAKALNLSKSTVSRAFKENSIINPKTRMKILDYANKLNYRPNHYASSLREQKSKTIAIVVPELANNFFTQIIKGVEQIVKEAGYHTLIFATNDDIQKEKDFITSISNGKVDGVLMSVVGEGKDYSYLNGIDLTKMPIVFFDRVYDDIRIDQIITDDFDSSFRATEHLIQQGCESIAYLVINKEVSIGKQRYLGYVKALEKYGLPFKEDLVVDCTNCYEDNFTRIQKLFEDYAPQAVFASVERLAFSTYYVCNHLGLSIPGDVKVIAFSSLEIAELLSPALSTIRQPSEQIGIQAAQILLDKLLGRQEDVAVKKIILQSDLIIRHSSVS